MMRMVREIGDAPLMPGSRSMTSRSRMASSFGSPLLGIVDMVATARREIAKGQVSLMRSLGPVGSFLRATTGATVSRTDWFSITLMPSRTGSCGTLSRPRKPTRADKALATSPTRVLNPR